MTVISVAAVTTKFLFGMCDCTADSDVGTGEFSLLLRGLARVWIRTCLQAWAYNITEQ